MRTKRASKKIAKKERLYVAVVMHEAIMPSKREDGSYACFIGSNKLGIIQKATEKAIAWRENGGYASPYVIRVGELTEKALQKFSIAREK